MAAKVLVTELYPYVEKAFSDNKNKAKFFTLIREYIDKNNEALSAIGPSKNILFTDVEKNKTYEIIGISPAEVNAIKSKSADIKSTGLNLKDPFKSLMAMIVRYFLIKKDNSLRITNFYFGMSMYSSVFQKYFKFPANENIMAYTVNNMSNKYKLKQSANLMVALDDTFWGALELYKTKLIEGKDKDIVQYILAIRTRLNSFMKHIRREYGIAHEEEKYLNLETSSNDPDDFREADSSIYAINRLVDKISMKLVVDGPNTKLIAIAAKNPGVKNAQVSVNEMRNYINTLLVNNRIDEIKKLIEAILFLYLFEERHSVDEIRSQEFLFTCMEVYKSAHSKNKSIITIKEILDKWLEDLGTYKKTNRVATINNFRRAIFIFFVLSIQDGVN